jgi:hypothetical protein
MALVHARQELKKYQGYSNKRYEVSRAYRAGAAPRSMISFNLAFAPFENLHRQPIAFFKRERFLKQPTEFVFFAQLRRKEARINFVKEYLPSLDLVWAGVGDFDLNVILIEIKDLCHLRTGFDHRV